MYVLLSHQKNEKANLDQKKTSCSSLCIPPEYLEEAMFAGGSFWGVEAAFGLVKGVAKTSTGYYGGSLRKPTYREVQNVSNLKTGHTEAVKGVYDKRIVWFTSPCEVFWDTHDPTDKEFLQFGVKTHLRSTIFYVNQEQRREIEENCHQKYYLQKNHVWLCESLNLRSTEQFADSHAACKLNGLLGGDCNDSNKKNKEELRRYIDLVMNFRRTRRRFWRAFFKTGADRLVPPVMRFGPCYEFKYFTMLVAINHVFRTSER